MKHRYVGQDLKPLIKRNFIQDTSTCIQCSFLLLSLLMGWFRALTDHMKGEKVIGVCGRRYYRR